MLTAVRVTLILGAARGLTGEHLVEDFGQLGVGSNGTGEGQNTGGDDGGGTHLE